MPIGLPSQQAGRGGLHGFIDESKDPTYLVVCAFVPSSQLSLARAELRSLLLPGQRSLHFTNERPSRRRMILNAMIALDVRVHVYLSTHRRHADGRVAALRALARDAVELRAERLVLERDDSVVHADRRVLASALRAPERVQHLHMRAHEEPLLWISDAFAWCWQKRDWQRLVKGHVAEVRRV